MDPVPTVTKTQLLAVACPTCSAKPGTYCEERPGKVLLLPHHHEARFRAAAAARPHKHGCCVDASCSSTTCMQLPDGASCADCTHVARCTTIFGQDAADTACQFFPRRFLTRADAQKGGA